MNLELQKQLKRQLKFLEKSSMEYDNGNFEEALRIAVSLRVLFHDTISSTSIFNYLEQKDKIYIPSTLKSIEEQEKYFLQQLNMKITTFDPPIMMVDGERKPPFGSWNINKLLPVESWWNEKILRINDAEYSRKDIVCLSANQDGGAHLDLKIKPKTKLLKKGTGRVKYKVGGSGAEKQLEDNHFLFLRQFAYEVLSAKNIYELNDFEFKEATYKTITYTGLLRKAEEFAKTKDFNMARDVLLSAIDYDSSKREAFNNIGCMYEELNESEMAIGNYIKAVEIDNTYIDPQYNLSLIYYKNKRYDLVLTVNEKILEVKRGDIKASQEYHHILNKLIDPVEALFQYHNTFPQSENKTYLYGLCSGLHTAGEYNFALIVCNKLLALYNEDMYILTIVGLLSIKLGQYDNAKDFFNQAEKYELTRLEACFNILEYNLIFNRKIDTAQLQECEVFFKKENYPMIIFDIFKILFKAVEGNQIGDELKTFQDTYKKEAVKYHFNDLKKWVKDFEMKNLEKPLEFFLKHSS